MKYHLICKAIHPQEDGSALAEILIPVPEMKDLAQRALDVGCSTEELLIALLNNGVSVREIKPRAARPAGKG